MKSVYKTLFIILLASACGKSEKQEVGAEAGKQVKSTAEVTITNLQFDNEGMQLDTISRHIFDDGVQANGMTDVPPANKASIRTFAGGYVKNTPLLIGNTVRKGQLLLTLENTEYVEIQQQYNEVAQQLRYLKSEYDRQKTLFDEKITSQKNFLKAESDYKSSLAMYNALRKKLQMMNINPDAVEQGNIQAAIGIYAPINGSITKVNVSTGSYVSPSEEIMEIVNTDHIHLELSVFEKDILKIKKGQKITFTIPEASDKIYTGEVHLVGTSVDPTDRTVKVHGHIEGDEDLNLVTGMYVEATIITHPVENYGLPVDAVVQSGDENFVLVLKGKKGADYEFEQVQVETGKRNADFVEIMNGAELKNKQILTSGAFMAAK